MATFTAAKYYKVGGQPGSLAVADVNGDGKLDLATANPDLSTVSVLRTEATALSRLRASTRRASIPSLSESATSTGTASPTW